MRLIAAAGALAIAGAVWLLLPVTHWPGYTSKSLAATSLGWGAVGVVLIPLLLVALGASGLRILKSGRGVMGLALLWFSAMVLFLLNFASHALGPFFLPSGVLMLAHAVWLTIHLLRANVTRKSSRSEMA